MFLRPRTLREALRALDGPEVRILAGGTDFYPALGERRAVGTLLDVTALPELGDIVVGPDLVRIGAGVSWTRLIQTPLPRSFDALKAAAREIGSVQIQNRATIAGNLCNASPAADGVPPLLALDAEIELLSVRGERRMPLASFIIGNRKTARRPEEMVTAVLVPRTIEGASAFLKLGARRYLVISIAMVAAILAADRNGRVSEARIAVGSCSPVARRLTTLERALVGIPLSEVAGAIRSSHLDGLSPIDDLRGTAEYRRDAAERLVARALEACTAGWLQ
ncbi:MAG TPA: xanthine dehydrogenase family protein subunit M [Alphaproteobacteria bacterium]|nr:xanthine dehydrogenase family protein subunit M [Alphaproteobacteria bacterium]